MLQEISSRELFTLEGAFPTVRGTYQRPHRSSSRGSSNLGVARVGVLFLNGLFATRSANGDAAVYWASSLAEQGYPSFRIDLPGFGDSEGDPPKDWLGYINSGRYAAVTAGCAKEITRRFGLSGVVIAGHCAGAVTAIYAAAICEECRGLVLMDPYFYLPRNELPEARQRLILWARRSRFGGVLSRSYDLLKQLRLMLYRNRLPENANVPLLRSWKKVAATGLPILLLNAPSHGSAGDKPRVGEFDYSSYIFDSAGPRHRILVKVAAGSNHSFSNHQGKLAVQQNINQWLNSIFVAEKRNQDYVPQLQRSKPPDNNERIGATNIA